MEKIQPIDIILVTFNRLEFLKKAVDSIYKHTNYPYRLWVIDNNSDDNTRKWLKGAKLYGYIHDFLFLEKNIGLAGGFSEGFDHISKQRGGISDLIITTQDDCLPPDLKPCWLERLVHLSNKYKDEYSAIAMRIERTRHKDVDESKDLIPASNSCPSVFRISRKQDIIDMGNFGYAKHWETVSFANKMKQIGKPRFALTTHMYASHIGFMPDNKGFKEGFKDYHTYAGERVTQGIDQPYPKIDPKTNIPSIIETPRDRCEQNKRDDYYKYWGMDYKNGRRLLEEQRFLGEYAKEGRGIDLGCGHNKCHPNAIGVDIFPFKVVDVIADARDLWMFKDNELDFIVATHILEHMQDVKTVLWEWCRTLKPGGILAIAVPDGEAHPKWICSTGHKINLGPVNLRILLQRVIGMELLESGIVPNKKGGRHQTAYAVAKKL